MNRLEAAKELVRLANLLVAKETKPKFKRGDKAADPELPEYTEVWQVGEWDDYVGDRRYVMMDPKTRRKINVFEKNLEEL